MLIKPTKTDLFRRKPTKTDENRFLNFHTKLFTYKAIVIHLYAMKKGFLFGLIGFGALGLLIWSKVSSISNMIDKLTITPKLGGKPKLKSSNVLSLLTGSAYVELPINVEFSNRSDQEMTIGVTSVMAYLKDTLVASNTPSETSVTIKAHSVSTLEGIKMEIPIKKLLSVLGTAIESAVTNGNFDNITNNLSIKIGATLNNSFVFDITLNLGKSGTVDTSEQSKLGSLGLTAASKRVILPLTDYINYIPDRTELKHNDYIVKANGSVTDTANIMHQAATADKDNMRMLALHLQKDTLPETLQSIFDFVYTHIQYELDSAFTEQVRRPLRTLYDQKGDCDCYATLIGSLLEALNIPYKFRIAAYKAGRYQHVYVIVPCGEGHYTVDPVLDRCFAEKPTTKHLDV